MSHTTCKNVLSIKPNWPGTGLCNQLFFIVSSIIIAHQKSIPIVVFDDFLLEPLTNKKCPLYNIIDLQKLNEHCQSKYSIQILDKQDAKFEVVYVIYGTEEQNLDLTTEIKTKFLHNNELYIPKDTIFNDIQGDPASQIVKKLWIHYKINNQEFVEEFPENLLESISIFYFDSFQNWDDADIHSHNSEMFTQLLSDLSFVVKYQIFVDEILQKRDKFNVIHIRMEEDMNGHMAKHNSMELERYIATLEDIYIQCIKKYFDPQKLIFVASYNFNNNVIDFLEKNGYQYFTTPKNFFYGREHHAIIDLLVCEKCTGTFIGNWNFNTHKGSTFSYVASQRMSSKCKQIFVDIYKLLD